MEARPATWLMAASLRASEAFISTSDQPYSRASAIAVVASDGPGAPGENQRPSGRKTFLVPPVGPTTQTRHGDEERPPHRPGAGVGTVQRWGRGGSRRSPSTHRDALEDNASASRRRRAYLKVGASSVSTDGPESSGHPAAASDSRSRPVPFPPWFHRRRGSRGRVQPEESYSDCARPERSESRHSTWPSCPPGSRPMATGRGISNPGPGTLPSPRRTSRRKGRPVPSTSGVPTTFTRVAPPSPALGPAPPFATIVEVSPGRPLSTDRRIAQASRAVRLAPDSERLPDDPDTALYLGPFSLLDQSVGPSLREPAEPSSCFAPRSRPVRRRAAGRQPFSGNWLKNEVRGASGLTSYPFGRVRTRAPARLLDRRPPADHGPSGPAVRRQSALGRLRARPSPSPQIEWRNFSPAFPRPGLTAQEIHRIERPGSPDRVRWTSAAQ